MRVAILGDCHLGARNGSGKFSSFFNRFFREVFYPYLVKNDIDTVFQLGDMFDSRTALSLKAYHACKATWFDPLEEHGIRMHILLGNHDIVHKNTLNINSPELMLGEYKNVTVHKNIATVGDFDIIPWICDENKDEVEKKLTASKSRYCLGHFEISGFAMYRGAEAHSDGLSVSMFDNYEMVFSGHYHHKSHKGNILYVGTPYEITWSDYADPKGFHILDTGTGKLEFIENPFTMFRRVVYNNGWTGDMGSLAEKYIKIVVQEKQDVYAYDRFLDSVKLLSPHDITIIENFDEFRDGEVEESINLEDSAAIIDSYIDGLTTDVDKSLIKSYMRGLYNEALTQQ
jgi:DNA repair exonuclease SbcCD nuclease subunit